MPTATPVFAPEAARPTQEVALDGRRSAAEARTLRTVARQGLSAQERPFPHSDRIRAAFGAHAPPGLRAHIGPAAARAGAALSASAFVLDGRAAFASPPNLRTAAHEAFHLFEQAGASRRSGGVGVRGDRSEALADRVADAVVAGRSVEPLLAQAPAAPPTLQMFNEISAHVGPDADTPWTEIANQLHVDQDDVEVAITGVWPGRFGPMIAALGDSCARAQSVTATLDGVRKGPPRAQLGDPMQSAYGALGSLESLLTNTATPAKYEFEGGHLISDEILGQESYVQYNFAPQRGHLNAPIYRKIEEIGMAGISARDSTVVTPRPATWTMSAQVTYPSPTYVVKTAYLQTLLGIDDSSIGISPVPDDVTITSRVPGLWTARVDSGDPDYVFDHESTIDPADGAYVGIKPTEQDVHDEFPNTVNYLDATYWAMNTLKETPRARPTGHGTGSKPVHTFASVQAVPRGQTAFAGAAPTLLPAPQPFVAPKLFRTRTYSEIPDGSKLEPTARTKRLREIAKDILEENEGVVGLEDLTETSLLNAITSVSMFKRQKAFTKSDILKHRPPPPGRGKAPKSATKAGKDAARRNAMAKQIVFANFLNTTGTMDFK